MLDSVVAWLIALQVAVMNDKYYNVKPPGSWRHGIQPVPFHSNTDDLFLEDPQRREAKLAFAASYSTALAVYGPELYEHVVLITATATKFLLNCTVLTAVSLFCRGNLPSLLMTCEI